MGDLTHFNEQGRAKMVDVTAKPETSRTAIAQSSILLNDEIYELVTNQKMKKVMYWPLHRLQESWPAKIHPI